MDKYEYFILKRVWEEVDDELLNSWGEEGWELVAVVHIPREDEDDQAHCFFKRPLPRPQRRP